MYDSKNYFSKCFCFVFFNKHLYIGKNIKLLIGFIYLFFFLVSMTVASSVILKSSEHGRRDAFLLQLHLIWSLIFIVIIIIIIVYVNLIRVGLF